MNHANGISPKTSTDGACLDWFQDSRGYCLDAPNSMPAGSSIGSTQVALAGTRRCLRGVENVGFETNPLIWEA